MNGTRPGKRGRAPDGGLGLTQSRCRGSHRQEAWECVQSTAGEGEPAAACHHMLLSWWPVGHWGSIPGEDENSQAMALLGPLVGKVRGLGRTPRGLLGHAHEGRGHHSRGGCQCSRKRQNVSPCQQSNPSNCPVQTQPKRVQDAPASRRSLSKNCAAATRKSTGSPHPPTCRQAALQASWGRPATRAGMAACACGQICIIF